MRQPGNVSPRPTAPPAVAEQEMSLSTTEWPRIPQGKRIHQGKPTAKSPWKPTGPKEQEQPSNPKGGNEDIKQLTAMVNKQQKSIDALEKMLTTFMSKFDPTGRAMSAPPIMGGTGIPGETSEINSEAEVTSAAEHSDVDDEVDVTLGAHAGGARVAN